MLLKKELATFGSPDVAQMFGLDSLQVGSEIGSACEALSETSFALGASFLCATVA